MGGGHHLRAIYAVRGFRNLLTARLVSQISDGWFQAGLAGSLLFNPTKHTSPIAIATGFAVLLLPYSLLGPYVGVFLDRWDRRASLSVANLVRAVLVIPAALLIWQGNQATLFALFALLVIAVNRFFLAGLSAALPRVVDDRELVTANAFSTTAGTIAFSIGLFSAASLVATSMINTTSHGYAVIAAFAAIGYLASGLLTRASFKPGELGPAAHERPVDTVISAVVTVAKGMVGGFRHLAERRAAARALVLTAAHRLLYGYLTLAVLLLYSRYFGKGTHEETSQSLWALGQVVIAGAAGAGIAALITPSATRRFGARHWITGLLVGIGVTLLVLGLPFKAGLLLIAAGLMNICSQSIKILVDATLQHECDDAYRGRVFSLNDTAFNLSMVLGLFVAAATVPANGKSAAALITIAACYFLLALWFSRASRPRP
ncbi:MFS family permease [Allocatelliglobosispora scoriae]|uniref:MFS family permease n=1 Tax=Allocatelliglobosispora scoriae TaxID=643052 RepID=A0A841BRX6_9ACTN|nr:MFS transporter [Allocatelliglobosispora scoriae]MBB5870994.1 MFS family permease [Allocatelliglobosispora scoriae]